jgi:hypothetical protein
MAHSSYYPVILLDALRKTVKRISQDRRNAVRDSKQYLPNTSVNITPRDYWVFGL